MNRWDGRRIVTVLTVIALVAMAAVALFRVPLQSIFVLGIALICPLMMIGMHGGGHPHGSADDPTHVGHVLRPGQGKEHR